MSIYGSVSLRHWSFGEGHTFGACFCYFASHAAYSIPFASNSLYDNHVLWLFAWDVLLYLVCLAVWQCLCVNISSRKKFSAGEGYPCQCIYFLCLIQVQQLRLKSDKILIYASFCNYHFLVKWHIYNSFIVDQWLLENNNACNNN